LALWTSEDEQEFEVGGCLLDTFPIFDLVESFGLIADKKSIMDGLQTTRTIVDYKMR